MALRWRFRGGIEQRSGVYQEAFCMPMYLAAALTCVEMTAAVFDMVQIPQGL
jgi:hypothetical protein